MQPEALPAVNIRGLEVRYLVDGTRTGGATGMLELTVPAGGTVPPPHSHTENEEIIYVLEGKLRYSVDGDVRDLPPGERMVTPRGSVHGFSNPHEAPAKALIMLTPDIGNQYFVDVAEAIGTSGPPNMGALMAVMKKYGLVVTPPKA